MMTRPLRILVAGARFGEAYLNAFLQDVEDATLPPPVLAGVLARGSPRARRLAHSHGVPLYTSIAQLPADLDLACVVVRGGAMGGDGCVLAEALLQRGLHVIQEHPLHPDEVERLQATAARVGRLFWINTYYPHTAAGRAWIGHAQRVRDAIGSPTPGFAHLATSRQLLYSSLDLVTQAAGIAPNAVEVACCGKPTGHAFQIFRLLWPGTEALLQLQDYLDPADPDMHSMIMHRMTLGWPSGYLSLDATFGPVTWTPALAMPGHRDDDHSWSASAAASRELAQPPSRALLAPPSSWLATLEVDGPLGVAWLLDQAARAIALGTITRSMTSAWQLALAQLWQRVQRAAGPPREMALATPPCLDSL